MPAYSIQFRRGTAADHSAFTGELAEITIDITNNRVILHDGETAGGIPLAKVSDLPIDVGDLTDVNGRIAAAVAAMAPAVGLYGDRAIVGGGAGGGGIIEYFDITSPGNSSTFGNLTDTNGLGYNQHAALSNRVYGVFSGGNSDGGGSSGKTDIDYVTIATLGNSSTFGNLSEARFSHAGCCDSTTGLFAGGRLGTTYKNTIDYITVATPGTATDFGNMQTARGYTSAIANLTYGLIGGGFDSGRTNTIDVVTVATPSNATDFGNLTVGRNDLTAVQSETRGVFCGGRSVSVVNEDTIDYVTFSTPSNATDFGNLITGRFFVPAGSSNGTRGCISAGYSSSALSSIEYITIETPGNASTFGNLLAGRRLTAGTSGAAA